MEFPETLIEKEITALFNSHISSSSQQEHMEGAPETAPDTFNWQVSDTALLLPNQLGISRVQRAWDRKPKTPFSRPGTRVGKVWKRAQNVARPVASEIGDERGAKRRKGRRSSPDGGKKPLKKMCLDSGFGLAPRVLAWDGGESPTRKIVTRTSASHEELVALPDEDESEQVVEEEGDVTVEILDEDGTVLDVNPEASAEDADWEDEEPNPDIVEDEFNDTMMHLAEIIGPSENSEPVQDQGMSLDDPTFLDPIEDLPEIEQENQDPALAQLPEARPVQQEYITSLIPAGFVSPRKPGEPVVKNRRRSFGGPRRRTLPRQFAPSPLSQVMNAEESFHEPAEEDQLPSSPSDAHTQAALNESPSIQKTGPIEIDAQWEDVEDVSPPPMSEIEQARADFIANLPPMRTADEKQCMWELNMNADDYDKMMLGFGCTSPQQLSRLLIRTGKMLPPQYSPVPTVEGPHPRLPLRRSPRRKSSSPRKKTAVAPPEKPHFVAHTPIKRSRLPLDPPSEPLDDMEDGEPIEDEELPTVEELQNELPSPLERSASAPPEEPQMSPRKPVKPRVSDDTALLQAFLNRAAENKGSRRMSAAKRESITNRRDSDTVRHALGQAVASPVKADVLGELDVNSPSPRKASAPTMDTSAAFDEVINEAAKAAKDEIEEDTSVGQRTRRSGRGTKKSQPPTPAAPNKIAIKGSADSVVLKRNETQEMALLTRNNTRKNKAGAVLPPLRLTKMGSQLDNAEVDDASAEKADGARSVKWAETLVEYFQGGEVSEASILSDELNAPTAQATDKMELDNSAPPASDTPSKPKIRRLKASRTAATPGKAPEAPTEPEKEKLPAPDTKPAAPTKRRSRIATPAKGLTNASLLPSDLDPQPVVPAPPPAAETKKATASATKKKAAPVSKLPAPAPSTSSLGQGKENLISSPAKKKPASATAKSATVMPTAKTFAPKLDFSKSASLQPTGMADGQGEVPGLMSPAKKGGRYRNVFSSSALAGKEGDADLKMEMPGLMSPAKKRTRRAG